MFLYLYCDFVLFYIWKSLYSRNFNIFIIWFIYKFIHYLRRICNIIFCYIILYNKYMSENNDDENKSKRQKRHENCCIRIWKKINYFYDNNYILWKIYNIKFNSQKYYAYIFNCFLICFFPFKIVINSYYWKKHLDFYLVII